LGDTVLDERAILKWILNKQEFRVKTGFKWLWIGYRGRFYGHDNISSSIKDGSIMTR
jgi:hypothetical protein